MQVEVVLYDTHIDVFHDGKFQARRNYDPYSPSERDKAILEMVKIQFDAEIKEFTFEDRRTPNPNGGYPCRSS